MSNFARDRRSADGPVSGVALSGGGSVTKLVGRPQRRAFDLIENLGVLRRRSSEPVDRPLSSVELLAAEMLMRVAEAMAPSLDEVQAIAARHGITGTPGEMLSNPEIVALVAERFPYRQPDRATCRAYYDSHVREFLGPDLYEGGEILIVGDVTDRDWRAEAYGRAERIIAMLHYDRRIFDDLVVYGARTARDRGGRVGPVPRDGWASEVAAPFFSLKAGEVFPLPVPSSHGFHILLMERIEAGRPRPYAEVEAEVLRRLTARSRLVAARQHLAALAASLPSPGLPA